jgi:hypothetical protein
MSDIYYAPILMGGLGNRLFQIASIYGLSRKHGCKFIIDSKFITHNAHSKADYSRFYREYESYNSIEWDRADEPNNMPGKFLNIPRLKTNTIFYGYFQSAKYFQDYRSDILRMFSPNEDEIEYINRKFRPEGAVFIHIRLGDYVSHPVHHVNLNNYYKEAISIMKGLDVSRFLVVSDDPDKCKKEYPMLIGDEYEHVGEITDVPAGSSAELISLFLMKMCSVGGICANSSFSWWGGWLNENPRKIITLPGRWFNTDLISSDIYYGGTIKISV